MWNAKIPTLEQAVYLYNTYFLNRTDVLSVSYNDVIAPVLVEDNLEKILESHVTGKQVTVKLRHSNRDITAALKVGTYAPGKDNKTRYLCLDFDGSNHGTSLKSPIEAVQKTASIFDGYDISNYIERSCSGKGYHLWIFFKEPILAIEARAIARALVPVDFELNDGEKANPAKNKGIEIFPKSNEIREDGVGFGVWLPFYHGAAEGGSQLFDWTPDLKTVDTSKVNDVLVKFGGIINIFEHERTNIVRPKAALEDNVWKRWRKDALELLDLSAVYINYLTGRKSGQEWLEARDPWSPTGDNIPSAGVADGSGSYEKGLFYSFITGEALTVFDFLRKTKVVEDNYFAACRYVANLTSVELPAIPRNIVTSTDDSDDDSDDSDSDNNNSGSSGGGNNQPPSNNNNAPQGQGPLPVINISNRQFRDLVADAWRAVLAVNNSSPEIFLRSGVLVLLNLKEQVPCLDLVDKTNMYGAMTRSANWVISNPQGTVAVNPTEKISADMVGCDHPEKDRLPKIEFITTSPIFTSTGELVSKPGYSEAAKAYFKRTPDLDVIDNIPKKPTQKHIEAAKRLLVDELFTDFPFVGAADLAHLFAAVFLPFIRQVVDGPTPLHVIEAPTPGTGKSKLCNLVSIVFTGNPCEACTLPGDDDNIRKTITSQLMKAKPIVLFDNVPPNKRLDSPAIASLLTTVTWEDRLLGTNKAPVLKNNVTWLLTANNPQFSMEIARRCIRIRLDAKIDQPWRRKGFKHEYVESWALENRGQLVKAILTLIQAWVAEGQPMAAKRLGTYEKWSSVIGGILEVIGVEGFLGNLEEMYEASDTEGNEWRLFVTKWFEKHGTHLVKVSELVAVCDQWDILNSTVGDGNSRIRNNRLQAALRTVRDRVIGNHKIEEVKNNQMGSFRLVEVNRVEDLSRTTASQLSVNEEDNIEQETKENKTNSNIKSPASGEETKIDDLFGDD